MKSVLIHLTDSANIESTIIAGLDLATRFHAKADGLFLIPALASTFWGYEAADYLPVLQKKLEQSAQTTLETFKRVAAAYTIPVNCSLIDEAFLPTLAQASRGYDVLVTSQPKTQPDSVVEMEFQAPDIIVGSACPTLVVPRGAGPFAIGSRIAIGWNNSREASRAVRDALPLLAAADDVLVLSVQAHGDAAHSTQPIEEYLANHGIKYQLRSATAEDHNVTETILSQTAQHKSDMLVMGAWGHSRFRELILGGVTRKILETAPLPVLLSH